MTLLPPPGGVPIDRSHCVPAPPATLRLRVPATLTFPSPPGGTGVVLRVGASAKGSNHSEVSIYAKIPAPDKIGMPMKGKPVAMKAPLNEGALEMESAPPVVRRE